MGFVRDKMFLVYRVAKVLSSILKILLYLKLYTIEKGRDNCSEIHSVRYLMYVISLILIKPYTKQYPEIK